MAFVDHPLRIGSCGSVLCEPQWVWKSVFLLDFDLWYVWSGRGSIESDRDRWEISAGSMICLEPGRTYHGRQDPEHRLGVSYLHFEVVDAAGAVVKNPSGFGRPCVGRMAEIELYERMSKHAVALAQSGDPVARVEATLQVRGLLAALHRAADQPALSGTQKEHHDAIWAAARSIRENPGEPVTVEAMAERAGYSPDHFSRLFKQIVRLAPKEFVIRARLERAQTLLRESPMSIEQIADALGYADVFFFSRQFKQRMGVAPSRWRTRG